MLRLMTRQPILVALTLLLALGFASGPALAEEEKEAWTPPPPAPDKFDWVQLTNGEWLKGEIIVLYDGNLEFDSDELDLQTFDLDDVQHIRSVG